MQELIDKLTEKAGLSPDQAQKAILTIKDFITEKFPMLAGAVDNFLPGSAPASTSNGAASTTDIAAGSGSMMDKISDLIPGQMGEKAEDFAKGLFGDKK